MSGAPIQTLELQGLPPDEAAAHWLVARDRGFTTPEAEGFSAWLAASPANAEAWTRAERLWASFEDQPDVLLEGMRVAALRARPAPQLNRSIPVAAAAAAAVLLLIGFAGWRSIVAMPGVEVRSPVEVAARPLTRYATAVGQRSTVVLVDKSQLTLDSDSALEVAFTTARRQVRLLRGQAFFSVAHDARHPFVVEAEGRSVTALGTAFDVRVEPGSLYVVLAKGSVWVADTNGGGARVRLSPGESFQAAAGRPGVVGRVDVAQALAWRTGVLAFRDEPLARAVAEMNRYGGAPVLIGDPGIGALGISGRFRTGAPARFARTLTEVYPLRVEANASGGLSLVRREPDLRSAPSP